MTTTSTLTAAPATLLALTLLIGCGSDYPATGTAKDPPAGTAGAATPAKITTVRVVPAMEERAAGVVVASGTLAAEEQVVLGMKVAGRLAEITVDLGTRVKQGDVVARLDPTDFRLRVQLVENAIQQARARLGLSQDGGSDRVDPAKTPLVRQAQAVLDEALLTRDRRIKLWEQQFIARTELDAAEAAAKVAESRYHDAVEEVNNRLGILAEKRTELELARQQLADTVLRAPIDGAMNARQAAVGEFLNAGAPVATLVRINPLRLRLAVPERETGAIRQGQLVRLTLETDPTVYEGRVARLAPAISEQNRALMIEAEIPNEQGRLRPGAFARAEIVVQPDRQLVTVPAEAIVTFAGVEKVLVVENGRAVEKRVTTGRRIANRLEILSGLAVGERVIVQPGAIAAGQPVTAGP
ncbi:MAG TPA: efflux RND transporter periplasmic adaptor subunit [Methylomirabilota bacterium]|nr:efflux RND transporter periplasmic adaptor subunit [Methylomirabilota bacterium]